MLYSPNRISDPFVSPSLREKYTELTRGRRTETAVLNPVIIDEDGAENIEDFFNKAQKRSSRVETPYKKNTLFPPTPPPSNIHQSTEMALEVPSPLLENNSLNNPIPELPAESTQISNNNSPKNNPPIIEFPTLPEHNFNSFKTPEKINKSFLTRESRKEPTAAAHIQMTPSINQARQKANNISLPPPVSPFPASPKSPSTPNTPPTARVSIASSPNRPSNLKQNNLANSSTTPIHTNQNNITNSDPIDFNKIYPTVFQTSTTVQLPEQPAPQIPTFSDNPNATSQFPTNNVNQNQRHIYQPPFSSKFDTNQKPSIYDNIPAINQITIGLYNDKNDSKPDEFEQFVPLNNESLLKTQKNNRRYRNRNKKFDSDTSSSDDDSYQPNYHSHKDTFERYQRRISDFETISSNKYQNDFHPQPIKIILDKPEESNQRHNQRQRHKMDIFSSSNDSDSDDIEITSIKPLSINLNPIDSEEPTKPSILKNSKTHFPKDNGEKGSKIHFQNDTKKSKSSKNEDNLQRIKSPFKQMKENNDNQRITSPFLQMNENDEDTRFNSSFKPMKEDDENQRRLNKQKEDDDDRKIQSSFKQKKENDEKQTFFPSKFDDDQRIKTPFKQTNENDDDQKITSPFLQMNENQKIKSSFKKMNNENPEEDLVDDIKRPLLPLRQNNGDDLQRIKSPFKRLDGDEIKSPFRQMNDKEDQKPNRKVDNDDSNIQFTQTFFPQKHSQTSQKDDENDSGFSFTPPPSDFNQKKNLKFEHFHETHVDQAPIFKPSLSLFSNPTISTSDNLSQPLNYANPIDNSNIHSSFLSQPNPIDNSNIHSSFLSQPNPINYMNMQSNPFSIKKDSVKQDLFSTRISRRPENMKSGIFAFNTKAKISDESDDEPEMSIENQLLKNITTPLSVKEQRLKDNDDNYHTPPRQVNKITRPEVNLSLFPNIIVSPPPDVNSPIPLPISEETSKIETVKETEQNEKVKDFSASETPKVVGIPHASFEFSVEEDLSLPLPLYSDDELQNIPIVQKSHKRHSHSHEQESEHKRRRKRRSKETTSNQETTELDENSKENELPANNDDDFFETMHNNSFPDYPSPVPSDNDPPVPPIDSDDEVPHSAISDHMSHDVLNTNNKKTTSVKKTYSKSSQTTNYNPETDDLPIALRRTMRPKTQPLRFWMNEKIIYRPDENGCLTQYAVQTDVEQPDEINPLSPKSKETIKEIIKEKNLAEKKKRGRKPKDAQADGSEVIPKRIEPGIENDQQTYISFKGLDKKLWKSNEVELLPGKSIEIDAKKSRVIVLFSGSGSAEIVYRNGKKWKMRQGGQAYICKGDFATISNNGSKKQPVNLFIINNN